MARFLALGHLVFILCCVLCFGDQSGETTQNHSQISKDSPTLTTNPEGKPNNDNTTIKEMCNVRLNMSRVKVEVEVKASKNTTYHLRIMDNENTTAYEENGSGEKTFQIPFENLSPCTRYNIKVKGCSAHGNLTFNTSGNNATINPVVKDNEVCLEAKFTSTQKWNLTKCIKITEDNSCEESHVVKLDTCNYTIHLPPVKPNISFNETIPSQFLWTNRPSQCNASRFSINCSEGVFEINKNVSLLPNKKYNCIGEYKYDDITAKSESKSVHINCDLKKNSSFSYVTHDAFEVVWNAPQNDPCSQIEWENYELSCSPSPPKHSVCLQDERNRTKCTAKELTPYHLYNCKIHATYSNKSYLLTTLTNKTKSTKPKFEDVKVINGNPPEHNSITITCTFTKMKWNGGAGKYHAEIKYKEKTVQSLSHKDCLFTFSNLDFLTTYNIEIKAMNTENFESDVKTVNASTKYNDKAVIGILAFLIALTSVGLLFVLFKLYLLKRKRIQHDEEVPLTQALLRVEPIYAEALTDTYITKNADDKRLFMEEFQSIPRIFSNYTLKEAKKDGNQSKNRYIDILPYDYTRVVLSTGGDQDYINASFIDGYQEPKKYIAAQGPKEDTVGDFWQMIWDQKSSIIVMVTRCEEGNKPKCAQYWPCLERETEIFDDFVVKIKTEQHCPDYIIRHLVLANKREMASEREVTHIQFISWPDHGVPGDPFMLLKLRRRVNSFKNFFSGPIVVHCSAGVGRTGTYISIDAMIESLEAEGRVDIYGYVVKLRRQRCLMVQVEPQYILIHAALIEHYQYGDTEISLSEFHSVLNTLRQKDGADGNLMEIEFQKIPKCKNWRTFNTASSEENKSKNRDSKVLPYDINRVLFRLDIEVNQTSDPEDEEEYSSDEEEESNEYINASFLEGYWGPKSLIAAQGPLPNTMAEFLLMLIQQRTKTLVMLTDCEEDGKDYCSQYWGEEKKVFGELEVEMKKEENFPAYVRRHLEIYSSKKKEIFKVDQYQFLKWKGRELPENAQELIEMIHDIKKNSNYDNSKISRRVPIVVHCNNGSSRTGIFCALWNLMDSASSEKFVDVFQVVKNLRKDRLGMVQTLEQYQFIYAALEGAFPVQNGTVKTLTPNHSEQLVINETTALLTETNCTSSAEHQEATDDKQNIEITEQEVVESETPLPPAEVAVDECSEEPAINGPTSAVNEVEISLS